MTGLVGYIEQVNTRKAILFGWRVNFALLINVELLHGRFVEVACRDFCKQMKEETKKESEWKKCFCKCGYKITMWLWCDSLFVSFIFCFFYFRLPSSFWYWFEYIVFFVVKTSTHCVCVFVFRRLFNLNQIANSE